MKKYTIASDNNVPHTKKDVVSFVRSLTVALERGDSVPKNFFSLAKRSLKSNGIESGKITRRLNAAARRAYGIEPK